MAEMKRCFFCGRNGFDDPLDKHHIFGGKNRQASEKYGLTLYLCHSRCHIFGKDAVHRNSETRKLIQQYGQRKAMKEQNWTTEEFIKHFGRNYLDD